MQWLSFIGLQLGYLSLVTLHSIRGLDGWKSIPIGLKLAVKNNAQDSKINWLISSYQ